MKVIIAGSRTINDGLVLQKAIDESGYDITEVVSGHAAGVDRMGEWWAHIYGKKLTLFPARWNEHGKSAGIIRNTEMADYADALIAVWDGKSRGTQHMINIAKVKGLMVFVYMAPNPSGQELVCKTMDKYNQKKYEQLGMPLGTATAILRKSILFSLIKRLELDVCFQCGGIIENINDLSIEHKEPWLDSPDPTKLFFDVENIAFSHISCNVNARRKKSWSKHGLFGYKKKACRCDICKLAKSVENERRNVRNK